MRENYTLTRLYSEQALIAEAILGVTKQQAHYLGTVLRLNAGDELRVFNGANGDWRAEIVSISRKGAELRIVELLRPPQIMPDIELLFAPVRRHRTNFIIEKATELGAAALRPVLTERTQFQKVNVEKLRAQAIEAAEQTERLDVPVIYEPVKLDATLKEWGNMRNLIFADEAEAGLEGLERNRRAALTVMQNLSGPTSLLVGPEGGFTPQERAQLRAQPNVKPVSLGPRILRTDTAALSLLTLWQVSQGDWG